MINVVVGKVFKDKMCDQWATWMLEESQKLGTTPAGNYKHPSYVDCLNWVVQTWKDFDNSGIKKKAKELGMTTELGPEIEGYHDDHFQDKKPKGAEVEVDDPAFAADLSP